MSYLRPPRLQPERLEVQAGLAWCRATVQVDHTVLYCTVWYCTVLYCTVLYCTTPEYSVSGSENLSPPPSKARCPLVLYMYCAQAYV